MGATTKQKSAWTTESEVTFIQSIGLHEPKTLEGYIKSCTKREDWGAIDREAVLAAARARLAEARAC